MTHKYKGKTIRIEQDEDPMSPRDWDNAGTMICWHKNYELGDENEFHSPDSFEEWWAENGKGGVRLPLYLYDHSGITMRTSPFSCPWDSGKVGWIYMTEEEIKKDFPAHTEKPLGWPVDNNDWKKPPIARALACLEAEVKTYDQYLTGDVYGYIIEDEDESCWGFYGEDYCLQEAQSVVDYIVNREKKEKQKKLKSMITKHVPLSYRQQELTL